MAAIFFNSKKVNYVSEMSITHFQTPLVLVEPNIILVPQFEKQILFISYALLEDHRHIFQPTTYFNADNIF